MSKYLKEVSKEELRDFPVEKFEGRIVLIDHEEDVYKAVEELRRCKLIGFDTETRPTFKKGIRHKVALLQLSTAETAYLFRINRTGLPGVLAELLSDPKICKTGVAITDDIKGLKEWRDFEAGGFVELQNMVKEYGIISAGLKKLAAIILGFSISKRQQVTNWENNQLSDAQLVYAATDAWVCHRIYTSLLNEGNKE